jgi:hypothetical protein
MCHVVRTEFEAVENVDLQTGAVHSLGDHDGDATCAVITPGCASFAARGEGITCRALAAPVVALLRLPTSSASHGRERRLVSGPFFGVPNR